MAKMVSTLPPDSFDWPSNFDHSHLAVAVLNGRGWQKINAGTRGCKIVFYYVEYIRAEFKAIRSTAEAEEVKTLQKAKKALHA